MQKIFSNRNDDIETNDGCSWECRKVNSGYGTQIIGFDFKNGTTFCRVYKNEHFDLDLKFNASKTNLSCAKQVYTGLDTE
ncbi:TPA: hypothetical protein R4426_001327 [Campylobacter jejuni]|nr:hypothetical protein [Campylobacter jejuni]